jgi:hypothetical protein
MTHPLVSAGAPPVIVKVPHLIVGELPPKLRTRYKEKFDYPLEFLPLGAGGTATSSINIEADSDFVIVSSLAVVTSVDNLTLVAFAPIMVDLKNTGSGRTYSSIPEHFSNVFGTAQQPAVWWKDSYVGRLRASSTMQVTLQNLDPANQRNVRISFKGFKIFGFSEKDED